MSFVRVLFVIVAIFLLSTLIDPYISLTALPQIQAANAALPLLLSLILLALTGRPLISLAVSALAIGGLCFADAVKMELLNTNIVYADFTILPALMQDPQLVLGFLKPTLATAGIAAGLVAALALLWWLGRREHAVHWSARSVCFVVAAIGLGLIATQNTPRTIPLLRWEVFLQATGASRVGVAGNILLGRMTSQDVKRPSDPKLAAAFWDEPLVRQALQNLPRQPGTVRPDIVLIQSESLFEPAQLCGMSDTPWLKNVAAQKPDVPTLSGNLEVPVFGGRTLQTEFEAITGAPISFYDGSMFAYYELLDQPVNAFPRQLGDMGYKTIAMHPNKRGFWNRNWAMPAMGYQNFLDKEVFNAPGDISPRGWVSDLALFRAVVGELDASDRPTFIMAITMDNHGPWGAHAPQNDTSLPLPDTLKGEARKQLADYLARSRDADKAYGFLLEALSRRERPTLVVFYGDHLPSLPDVYRQLCFKDGKRASEHHPPFRVWANFPVPEAPATTSAYLMQGWIARAAGLPLEGQILANAAAGQIAHEQKDVPAAERARILAGYANIAAAWLEEPTRRKAGEPATLQIGPEKALSALQALRTDGPAPEGAAGVADLALSTEPGQSVQVNFEPKGGIAWMTLRPYLLPSSQNCTEEGTPVRFTVEGDGRPLYSVALGRRALRLATLDLRGVKTVTFRTAVAAGAKGCDEAYVRLVQMQCTSTSCGGSLTQGTGPVAALEPRSLKGDSLPGDLAALSSAGIVIAEHTAKTYNIQRMMKQESGRQVGFSEFLVQSDGQLRLHPGEDRISWIEFDVRDLDRVVLSPRINRLNESCLALKDPGREGGLVGFTVLLDGKPTLPRRLVDRNAAGDLPVETSGAHTLRLEVDKGNDVAWCDWFSVGFPQVHARKKPKQEG